MFDLMNDLDFKRGIAPAAAVADNTPFVSQILDTQGYRGVAFAILTGDLADADASFTVLVEHGDQPDLADAAPVPDEELIGTEALASFTAADDNRLRKIGYRGGKRYVRVTVTPANNAANAYVAGLWVCEPNNKPAPNPPL